MKIYSLYERKGWAFLFIVMVFILLYFQTFTADYAYLDEIHQLWHNHDGSNFTMFLTQGRWLTGLLFQKFFGSISKMEQLKWLRIFSLCGWMATAWLWSVVFTRWVQYLHLQQATLWLGNLYMACSISVCIFIGWASCMEVFLAVSVGLLSGHVLFSCLIKQQGRTTIPIRVALLSLLLGIVSLFIYQTAYGIFLLPFFLLYMKGKAAKPGKVVIIGCLFYLVTYVVYYLLFNYSLQAYHTVASTRTALNLNLWSKVSFFFSGPLPQGFSLNLLFSASSIFSQVFYPAVILIWAICVFKNNRHRSVSENLLYMVVIMGLLALIYLPLMVAQENFASYRTLLVFNMAVFIMVMEEIISALKSAKARNRFAIAMSVVLLLTGFYAYNFQYMLPLKQEYKALRAHMQAHYHPAIQTVYFIRADKHLFSPHYHTRVYRDEFGAPSTYRDWVPEPVVKQLVYELTGNRAKAEAIRVVQFENEALYSQANPALTNEDMVIDMDTVFNARMGGKKN